MVDSPSARPTWATNFISPGESREKPKLKEMGDLRLSGYKAGLRGTVLQWSGRVVKVVIHQPGQKDQVEYLDKTSVTAAYLRLAGMTGISDRDEVVNKLAEDKEVQRYALQSIGQYDSGGGKIDINMKGQTKDLTFDYVNFSDHVKEKLFHKKVQLQLSDNKVEEHFANPIAMASQCLKRSGIEGVSDNPDRIYELALQKRIQDAAWDSLENKHGSDWVQGERDTQGKVVEFRYDANKFKEAAVKVIEGRKEEGFLTKLMHALFGRKEEEPVAIREVPTEAPKTSYWTEPEVEQPSLDEVIAEEEQPVEVNEVIVQEPKEEKVTEEKLYEKMEPIFGDWMTLPGFKEAGLEEMIKLKGTPELVEKELAGLEQGDGVRRSVHFANEAVANLDRKVVVDWILKRKQKVAQEAEKAVSGATPALAGRPSESEQIDTSKVQHSLDGKRVTMERFRQSLGNEPLLLDQAYELAGSTEDEELKANLTKEFEDKGFKLLWSRPLIDVKLEGGMIVTTVSYRPLVMDKNSLGNEKLNEGAVYSGFKRTERIDLASGILERKLRVGGIGF